MLVKTHTLQLKHLTLGVLDRALVLRLLCASTGPEQIYTDPFTGRCCLSQGDASDGHGLRMSMVGYRCPVIVRVRGKINKKFAEAMKKSGLDDHEKLIGLAVETLEKNLASTRHIDCGLNYKKMEKQGVDVARLPKRFNQTVPDLCFEKSKTRGSASEFVDKGRALRKQGKLGEAASILHEALGRDCASVDLLLERAIVYALQKKSFAALGLLDRVHQQNAGRAFAAYRDLPALQKMPRFYSWNRFLARYEHWSRDGCAPNEKHCKAPKK